MTTQQITVNNKEITITLCNGKQYVAIKPICEAIGVDYDKQLERINRDEILNQLTTIRGVVAGDGKKREMRVLPLKYIFGWLFTIQANSVKPEIKQQVLEYRMECYEALFERFTKRDSILKERNDYQQRIFTLEKELQEDERFKEIQDLKKSIKNASQRLNSLDKNSLNEQLSLLEKPNAFCRIKKICVCL